MKEHPILFSTEMVQAILEGRKTQTRRVVKPQPEAEHFTFGGDYPPHQIRCDEKEAKFSFLRSPKTDRACFLPDAPKLYDRIGCPYGEPGDRLWVRETWAPALGDVAYKADYSQSVLDEPRHKGIWKPSIHMPKTAARIWLEIEEVKVERLQDISEEDAKAEGILPLLASSMQLITQGQLYFDYSKPKKFFNDGLPPFWSFNSLWCSINGPESWEANPWVWVVKFKVISITGVSSTQNPAPIVIGASNQQPV